MYNRLCSVLVFASYIATAVPISGECVSLKNVANYEKFEVVYEWNYLNYTWPSQGMYRGAVEAGKYLPEHNAIVGVKAYNERLYLALPKAKPGGPVTLASISVHSEYNRTNQLLAPFPNWEVNVAPGCQNLQSVQSMEIDRSGVMWVLDGRKIDAISSRCPPKILLLDLNSGGRLLQSYNLPNDVCSQESCFLNDIVLDEIDGGYAYITDTSSDPGIIVYSRMLNRAWKVRDSTMFAQDEALNFVVHNYTHNQRTPVDGIALAPRMSLDDANRLVYYTALTGLSLYAINSRVLRNQSLATSAEVSKYILDLGKKTGPSDGLMMDSEGDLYFGLLAQDAVAKWNTKQPLSTAEIVDRNPNLIIWPDSFGFDQYGNLYLVANNIGQFFTHAFAKDNINFRVLKLYTGTCGYQY